MNNIPSVVDQVFRLLTNNSKFIDHLENCIQDIIKNDNFIMFDIPEIIFIIVDAYNIMSEIKLDSNNLPLLIKLLFNYIVDKFELIPENKKAAFDRLVDSAIKLIMLQPIVKNIKYCCLCHAK